MVVAMFANCHGNTILDAYDNDYHFLRRSHTEQPDEAIWVSKAGSNNSIDYVYYDNPTEFTKFGDYISCYRLRYKKYLKLLLKVSNCV